MTRPEISFGGPEPKRLNFDPTINLGHLISLVAFLLAGLSVYNSVDKRLTVVEEKNAALTEKGNAQNINFKEVMVEVKADLKELQRSVNDVNRTLFSTGKK